MIDLFTPLDLPERRLPNRIVLAPMTRGRAGTDGVPTAAMAEYYGLRAKAGLVITEGICVSARARGWNGAPGLFTPDHRAGWQIVTDAVHAAGGTIIAQLWFLGRVSHPDFLDGATPWAPSAIPARQNVHTPSGLRKECVVPREMTLEDIAVAIADFGLAASLAIDAGFDGVEIHGANGYLPDQFLRDGTNRRRDIYGGSVGNRIRFLSEVVEACARVIGPARTGVRLSPRNRYNDMEDSDPAATFTAAAAALSGRGLAFLEIVEGLPGNFLHVEGPPVLPAIRTAFDGVLIANAGYDKASANAAIATGRADAIAFGVPFLANPDLVERFEVNADLNAADPATFYTPGEPGYLSYPRLHQPPRLDAPTNL